MKKILLTFVLITMISMSALFAATLSEEDIQKITWVREEEKLARDVYLTLYEIWGIRTFSNIAKSEQVHMDAVRDELIIPYGIEDPVTTEEVGVFNNPEIQALYDELIEKGSASVQDAVTIGLLIEDMDIYDLEEVINSVDDDLVKEVMGHLQDGSENHMRAFAKQADKYGVEYEPEYISEQEMNGILSAPGGSGQNAQQNQGNNSGEACDGDCKGHDNANNHSHGEETDNGNNGNNGGNNSSGGNGNGNNGNNGGKGGK